MPDGLVFQYVGVPPGQNARARLARVRNGHLRNLFTEGWPQEQRTGRIIGRQRVVLRLDAQSVEVFENGERLRGPLPHGLPFRRAYLHLEVGSHSNYPPRVIFLDDVVVTESDAPSSF